LYSVGYNLDGTLGNGNSINVDKIIKNEFFESKNLIIEDICCGEDYVISITNNGEIYGWGSNINNQLVLFLNFLFLIFFIFLLKKGYEKNKILLLPTKIFQLKKFKK